MQIPFVLLVYLEEDSLWDIQGAVAQLDRASASWSIGHDEGNFINECGQIQGSLKLLTNWFTTKVILSQAL